jgi:hypothetical protein
VPASASNIVLKRMIIPPRWSRLYYFWVVA